MQKFIGIKLVQAEPMTMLEAQEKLGRDFKQGDTDHDGYLVQYEDGYKSWCPKGVFEKQYFGIDPQNVTDADCVRLAKAKGWNVPEPPEGLPVVERFKEYIEFIADWAVKGLKNE